MPLRRSPGLRTSFLLILLLGAVLPLGIVGWWLTRTTQTSGEELLRSRLEQSLADMVQTVGSNWVDLRSNILALSENETVRMALAEGQTIDLLPDDAGWGELESAWALAEQAVERVVFYDLGNVYSKVSDMSLTELRHVLGVGVRLVTPIGPFRLEYGRKLDRQEGESAGELYLSIGYPF